jgi:branched-chain amino acid transport system ATP-binding protein
MALLEITDLEVRYGHALALDGVSLNVGVGELVGVLGPNGAGKTTLLKAISRTVPPISGRVMFDGRTLDGLPAHKVVGRGICHCPEGRRLFPELSVLKNLMLGAYLRRDQHGIAQDLDKVHSLFPVLRTRAGQQANTLSGGEQQMLAIGRILRTGAHLLLLDEPTEGLAPVIVQQIGRTIVQLKARGFTILLVEQNFHFAATVADRHYVMEHGRIIDMIPNSELDAKMPKLHEYLGV